MDSPVSKNPEKLAYLSLPNGLRLVSEDYFLRELEKFGITRRGFRSLCLALKVPSIEMGKIRLIDPLMFSLAMRFVMGIGEKNFLVPGCETLRKGRDLDGTTVDLDVERFKENMEKVMKELLLGQQAYRISYVEAGRVAREAARRMVSYGVYLATQQASERLKEVEHAPKELSSVSEL